MLVLVMGVTGCGKSTVGRRLAARVGLPFLDADDFHPPENRRKMAANVPLDDADRAPWLERLAREAGARESAGGVVLACSALKAAYRRVLAREVAATQTVFLDVGPELAARRLVARRGTHAIIGEFSQVLAGQYRDLEPPADALVLAGALGVDECVERAVGVLRRRGLAGGSLRLARARVEAPLAETEVAAAVDELVAGLGQPRRVLLVPPDHTRVHSGAGALTVALHARLAPRATVRVLPALGTHAPMTAGELAAMFPGIPAADFLGHDFRGDLTELGVVPASFVEHVSGGRVSYPVACRVNAALASGEFDRIVSIGQLVPHEVVGIANHTKNIFIGTGGKETIDRTHYLGALCGMESLMGRAHSPVRDVLGYMAGSFASHLPLTYLCTVRRRGGDGVIATHGLFAGDDEACFLAGVPLVQALNLELLAEPLRKVVVMLDPREYRSTWLGNKAIYRTRMAIADGGELVVIGPGVRRFGEDAGIDRLIRRHGYQGTERVRAAVAADPELAESLSAAAHLVHGSAEGRFRVCWAAGGLAADDVRRAGYTPGDVAALLARYSPAVMRDGMNVMPDGEEVFYVSNPGLGLWALREQFRLQ